MAVKLKIGKSAYDALPADVKKEYKPDGDDFALDLEGYEDPAKIISARDRANQERDEAKRERDTIARERDAANRKIAAFEKDGSVDDKVAAATKELQTKYDTDTGALNDKINKLTSTVIGDKKNELALNLARKISTVPDLMAPRIAERIHVELGEDFRPVHKVLGSDGKPSASSLDDLEKSFLTNKDFAPVLIASKGNGGGGAPRLPDSGGRAPRTAHAAPVIPGTDQPDLSRMDPRQLAGLIEAGKQAGGS